MKKKTVALLLALVLVFGVAAGGTLAWLIDKTNPVTNTFTVGDINIELTETTGNNYKIVPGLDISKDPKVTVKAGSEACWLFVKVDEANWPTVKDGDTRKVNYTMDGWTQLPGVTGVYYREVSATTADTAFAVLTDNKITVSTTLTKAEANAITTPTLTFTAYAVQKDAATTAADAWVLAIA